MAMEKGRVSGYVTSTWLKTFGTVYMSLHMSNPDVDDPVLSEVSGGGYMRALAKMVTVSSRATVNDAPVAFIRLPSVLVTYVGIWDKQSGGNLLASAPLSFPQRLVDDSSYVISKEDIAVSLA